MNIKEEIKLFEKHAQKFFTTNDAFAKECDNYIYDEVKFMWDCWVTAKQQAVPEGFVIVPVEPTQVMLDKFPEVVYQDTYAGECSVWVDDETIKIGYKAMIQEAQK